MTTVGFWPSVTGIGLSVGIGTPIAITYKQWGWVTSEPSHAAVWIIGIFVMMNVLAMFSLACLSIANGMDKLTPDECGGVLEFGLFYTGLLASVLVIIPGGIYLFVLPISESGSYDVSSTLSFDPYLIPAPE